MELIVGGVLLEHVVHVVEVHEGVINGNSIYFARGEGSLGNQTPNIAKSVNASLHHHVSGMRLALHLKIQLSLEQGGAESLIYSF